MGDLVSEGGDIVQWDEWFDFGEEFFNDNLTYSTVGNHDQYDDVDALNYQNMLVLPQNDADNSELYYSFTHNDAVFICLNSSKASHVKQYNWLLNTLEENKDKKWKVVWFHIPFFTSPVHSYEMHEYLDTWWQAFDDYGVDLIFNGHTHNYQRSVPINRNITTKTGVDSYGDCPSQGRCQIVTGGGGADSYGPGVEWFDGYSYDGLHYVRTEVFGDSMVIQAVDQNNAIIERFSIVKDFNLQINASATKMCEPGLVTLKGTGAETYIWDNNVQDGVPFELSETSNFNLTGTNSYGCIDNASIEIALTPKYYFTESYTMCSMDSLFWRGAYYQTAGTYYDMLQTVNGCDSIFELQLEVNPAYFSSQNESVCEGDSISWRGIYYNVAGKYSEVQQTVGDCSSIFELDLSYNTSYFEKQSESLCEGDSIFWRGAYYNSAGIYEDFSTTAQGCDSAYSLDLIVKPSPPKPEILGATEVTVNHTEVYSLPENDDFINNWSTVNGEIVSEWGNEVQIRWPETGTGFVYLKSTNQHDCASDTAIRISITEGITNSIDLTENDINIYPNPANGVLNIEYTEEFSIEIYNISGEIVLMSNNSTMDISLLQPGIYILSIRNSINQQIKTHKLIVE